MTIIINPELISKKSKQDEESYIRRRDHLLEIVRRTKWDEEEKVVGRRVVKYIKKKNG